MNYIIERKDSAVYSSAFVNYRNTTLKRPLLTDELPTAAQRAA